ncbi:hypothetical protein L226DRAFT_536568 [Lentinus tigrinus ALCF2SS1-7]|uniref:Uncharacterized protein n=1 Tax=Lentinus tigrinus ALCF2SS1-6 TaxID=1328759 RepID=A0A5C2S370_9APHY|nr:hypothetical protein L227DRAFT_235270 [Lentinus tigrinus ALCF2SS1-6]RPD73071.1 hypothetical protein L226DRAFT_536568 [Lentinus tigrinus ALCF2SS1-7]
MRAYSRSQPRFSILDPRSSLSPASSALDLTTAQARPISATPTTRSALITQNKIPAYTPLSGPTNHNRRPRPGLVQKLAPAHHTAPAPPGHPESHTHTHMYSTCGLGPAVILALQNRRRHRCRCHRHRHPAHSILNLTPDLT